MRRLTNEEKQSIISLAKKGLMAPEISKIINKSVSSVWRVLSKNGIKTVRNVTSIRRIKNCENKEYTKEQYEILYGTLLGDSSLQFFSKKSKTPAFTCCHSQAQKEYSFLLSEKLNGVCKKRDRYDKRTNKTYISYDVRTKTNQRLLPIYNELYKTGTKQVTREYAEKLTARSIAFWFMDDGYKHDETFILCTDSFNVESCDILCETIFKKFGITFRKLKHGNNYRLRLIYDDGGIFPNLHVKQTKHSHIRGWLMVFIRSCDHNWFWRSFSNGSD